jgi:hypothetical protein
VFRVILVVVPGNGAVEAIDGLEKRPEFGLGDSRVCCLTRGQDPALSRVMKRVHQHCLFDRSDDHDVPAVGKDDAAQSPFAAPFHCLSDHSERTPSGRIGGRKVEAPAREEDRIDERRLQEVLHVDCLVVGRLELIQFVLRKLDVLVRLIGIPLDDLFRRDGAMFGAPLPILDALAAAGVQLAQRILRRRGDGGVGLYGHAEVAEAKLSTPTGAAGRSSVWLAHVRSLSHDTGCHTKVLAKVGERNQETKKGRTKPKKGAVRPGETLRQWLRGFLHVIMTQK